jgi:hypothetical protein
LNNISNIFPESQKKFCYWSIGDKKYALILNTLVKSARSVGVTEDFHVWADRKIEGAINHYIDGIVKEGKEGKMLGFEFKFKYLKKMLDFDYDYYVYLDSDTYFVRKPRNPLTLLKGDSMHMFLESNLFEYEHFTKPGWEGCSIPVVINAMRDMGVKSERIYNINGGFWIISKNRVYEMIDLVYSFWKYMHNKGHNVADETGLSYAMHMLCSNTENHLLRNNLDFYGFYLTSQCRNKLPDGKSWEMEEWFTGQKILVNPAIVHCFYSKELLIDASLSFHKKIVSRIIRFLNKKIVSRIISFLSKIRHFIC